MNVIVCGPRDWADGATVYHILDSLRPRPTGVLHGAAHGVDAWAAAWARASGIATDAYPAHWQAGRQAGPQRNARMLHEGTPRLVVAIKREGAETPGTSDMVRQARRAGVPVRVFRVAPDGTWREEGAE